MRRGRRSLDDAAGIRSTRLNEHLAVVRTAAAAHANEALAKELMDELDAHLTGIAERRD